VLFGWFAALLGLYCFAAFVHYRRWYWLLGGLVFSAGVLMAARWRAIVGLAAAAVGGFLASWWPRRDWRASARQWAPVAAGLLLVGTVFAAGLGDLIEQTQNEYLLPPVVGEPGVPVEASEGTAREALYRGALVVAADYFPLGAGLGRYGSWMSRIEYSPVYHDLGFDTIWGLKPSFPHFITDTFWPQILGEIGVFGVLAYVVFIGAVGIGLWRAAHAFDDPLLAAFCLGTLMVFGHALVETLASSMFHSPPRVYLLFGAVGMALSLLRVAGPRGVARVDAG
jgi:hypothetical protein